MLGRMQSPTDITGELTTPMQSSGRKRVHTNVQYVFLRGRAGGTRIFKLTINLQQANAQLFLPRTAIKSAEQLPNPWAGTNRETWETRQVNAPDLCKQLLEGALGTLLFLTQLCITPAAAHRTQGQIQAWLTLCEMRIHHFWLLWVPLYLQWHHRPESGPSPFSTCLDLDSKWALAEDKSY